ncbi:MAG: polyphosphate kinase 2 family protein, partial [Planctomycetia bacterium]|nr:polyphosphate kinase 2 family protein [Planctomycetia bacterium]
EYMVAYEDAINRCTTDWAPWYVIPSDQKWYRNLAITRIVVSTLRRLDPRFPKTTIDPDRIRIE